VSGVVPAIPDPVKTFLRDENPRGLRSGAAQAGTPRAVPSGHPLARRSTAPGNRNSAAITTIVAPVGSSQTHDST
jgi:hypothetical protein